jgi:hypothetical protein
LLFLAKHAKITPMNTPNTFEASDTAPDLATLGQHAPGWDKDGLDFSSPHDEVVEYAQGTLTLDELSDAARDSVPSERTDVAPGYDATNDYPNQKGGLNHRAWEHQTVDARASAVRGIALARNLRSH